VPSEPPAVVNDDRIAVRGDGKPVGVAERPGYDFFVQRGRLRLACVAVLAGAVVTAAAAATTSGDPLVRLEGADQARANRLVLQSHDFPSGWRYRALTLRGGGSIDATCSGLDVDLSALVITGQAGSRGTRSSGSLSRQNVVTEAFLFATPGQARTIQARLTPVLMRRCIDRAGTRDAHGGRIDSVSRLGMKARGVSVDGYRVVVSTGKTTTYGDYLFLQAHRTWVTIFYSATPAPPALDEQLLQAVAARIR
jgi:hypothetical protein